MFLGATAWTLALPGLGSGLWRPTFGTVPEGPYDYSIHHDEPTEDEPSEEDAHEHPPSEEATASGGAGERNAAEQNAVEQNAVDAQTIPHRTGTSTSQTAAESLVPISQPTVEGL
jgi:hypothetical protein